MRTRSCARCCGGLRLLTAGFGLLRDDGMGALWRLCVANFMAYFVFFGFITNFQLFLQTSLNLSSTDCASYIATFSLFSLGTKSSILPLRRLLTERTLITLGFCAFAAGCLLLAETGWYSPKDAYKGLDTCLARSVLAIQGSTSPKQYVNSFNHACSALDVLQSVATALKLLLHPAQPGACEPSPLFRCNGALRRRPACGRARAILSTDLPRRMLK